MQIAYSRYIFRRLLRSSAVVLAAYVLAACDATNRASSTYATAVSDVTYELSESPVITIGGEDERQDYAIGRTVGAFWLEDDRLVIADGLSRQLRFYSGEGQLLRTAGGEGEGPGEFRRLHSISRTRGDSIVAWDAYLRRVTVFAPNGDFAYSTADPAWSRILGELQTKYARSILDFARIHLADSSRFVFELNAEPNLQAITHQQVVQDTIPVIAISRTGETWIELGPFPGREYLVYDGMGAPLALGEDLRVAAANEVLYVGSTRDTAIHALSPIGGSPPRSIALPWRRRPTLEEDVNTATRRFLNRIPPDLSSRAERFVNGVPWPDSLPTFSDLLVSSEGTVWVQMFRAPADALQEWIVFTPSGEVVGSVALDTSLKMLDVGADYALVQAADARGVEAIRLHRLRPSDGR